MIKLLRRTIHYAIYGVAGAIILMSVVTLALRVWIMPDIDRYRPDVERLLAEATGLPVRIGALHADWQGLNPRLSLDDLRIVPAGQLPCLTLPKVTATVSWTSLLLGELRLSSIEIVRPHLVIRQDKQRVLYVAGIPVNTPGARSPFPDWLLEQRLTAVYQATLVWQDDLLEAPPLTLSDLDLVLSNRFGRHRLGLTAHPPESVARKLDARVDFKGRSIQKLDEFAGRLYVRLEGASSEALRTWAPWAQESVRSGVGALRFWLDFSGRRVDGVVGDVRLHDVQLGPTEYLPEIRFARISGRLGWRQDAKGQDYFVERLSFVSPQGHKAEPASVKVRLAALPGNKVGEAHIEAKELQLEALTALIGAVPIPRQAHDLISTLTPRGFVDHLQLDWLDRSHYKLEARFREVGIRPGSGLPGLAGLSGEIRASEQGGVAHIASRQVGLDYAEVFRQPLAFDRLRAKVAWSTRKQGEQEIRIEELTLGNAELDVTGGGSIVLRPGAAPLLDLNAHLTRGDGTAVWRYLPWAVADDAYEWVKRGIKGGVSNDTRLTLKGAANKYPFKQGEGLFRVEVKISDAVVEAAPGWPLFTQVNGVLLFHGPAMSLWVDRAQVQNIQLYGVKGLVPDLHFSWDETLSIEGRARGSTADFLDYIRASPVYDHTERFTEPMRAEGRGELALRLNLPLRRLAETTVAGIYRAVDNRIEPGHGLPVLEHLSGDLSFTHRQIKARDIAVRVLDQPGTLDVASGLGGRVDVTLNGRAEARRLAAWVPPNLLARLSGAADYKAEIAFKEGQGELRLTSDLKGLAIDLPDPLHKAPDQPEALLITHSVTDEGKSAILARYGQVLTARGLFGGPDEQPRVSVRIGSGEAGLPKAPGLTLEAMQKRLDLDQWLAFVEGGEAGKALRINEIALTANELILADRIFKDTQIKARPAERGWQIKVAGREVQGEIVWEQAQAAPRIQARLKRLALPDTRPDAALSKPGRSLRFGADIQADNLVIKDRSLGALALMVQPASNGLEVQNISLSSPDGRLEGRGLLSDQLRRPSSLQLNVDSPNLSGLLDRLGYPGRLKRGEGSVRGQLAWEGGLEAFSLGRLNGDLNITLRNGQFTKLDPGVARLLGVVSLQALPRRISLDFRDIFSEGFAFDQITTPVHLEGGVAYLADFQMRGPAASVAMKGKLDLTRETQSLRVAIQPRLEDTLAAGAMLVNPAVGLGALVASKVLKDPISKAATYEYLVTGNWAEPEVTRLARPQTAGTDAAP